MMPVTNTFSKKIRNIFKKDEVLGVSKLRLYLMRFVFTLNLIALGGVVWSKIFTYQGQWEAMAGVTYSFWAALSALSILGLIHPLKMLPLLLLQFSYKLIWLTIIAFPEWSLYQSNPDTKLLITNFIIGVIIELITVPWKHVFKNYILKR